MYVLDGDLCECGPYKQDRTNSGFNSGFLPEYPDDPFLFDYYLLDPIKSHCIYKKSHMQLPQLELINGTRQKSEHNNHNQVQVVCRRKLLPCIF